MNFCTIQFKGLDISSKLSKSINSIPLFNANIDVSFRHEFPPAFAVKTLPLMITFVHPTNSTAGLEFSLSANFYIQNSMFAKSPF